MAGATGYLFDFPREFLKPALVVSLLSVWVLVGLFFYLNAFTRRRYFAIWNAAWLFYALWLTLAMISPTQAGSPMLLMLKQWCVGIAAVFLIWGAASFLRQPVSENVFVLFLIFLVVWSYLVAYCGLELLWGERAIFATIGLGSGMSAYGFFQFRRRFHYVGASLLAIGFLLWGCYLGSFPLWQSVDQLVASGFFISAVLQLFIAVSMIILVLEEVRATNHEALLLLEREKTESRGLRTKIISTEERYRSLFAQASEGIVLTASDDLRILELNPAARRLLGMMEQKDAPQCLSKSLRLPDVNFTPSSGLEWFTALTKQHRVDLVRADGTTIRVEVAGAPVQMEGMTAYQFFLREVTERARLEQQLRQSEKLSALGQMISGIAHELNNPLAIVKGYLDLVLLRDDLAPRSRVDLEKVVHESNRAARLVGNFLSFARERPASREAVDLNRLIRRMVELRQIDLRICGVQASLSLEDRLPRIDADAAQLEQVLVNLLTNSIHALSEWPGARSVRISTAHCGASVVLRMEDSGPGIPGDVLPHIFEPFFTTKPVGSGTGLGLSIAHSIVSEHKGRISYEQAGLGGASFVLEFPALGQEMAAAMELLQLPPPEPKAILPFLAARILVVDDEPLLVELLVELLSSLGHFPVGCASAIQALELLSHQAFDLILSDYRMPMMTGGEFYQRLAEKHPELSNRVIFVTGDVVAHETRAFLDSIGAPHLSKPFQLHAVEALVADILYRAQNASQRLTGTPAGLQPPDAGPVTSGGRPSPVLDAAEAVCSES